MEASVSDADDKPGDRSQAVIERIDVCRVMSIAKGSGPLVFALMAWLYEFGARASEVGLQLVQDVDLRAEKARPVHLKGGHAKAWHMLLPFCLEALPPWLKARPEYVQVPEQKRRLFPGGPGHCYACKGTGKRAVMKRDGQRRYEGERVPCHHCDATGRRFGISRVEVHDIASRVFIKAGFPEKRRHPHMLRHSIITHLLDGGLEPRVIQDRVGHQSMSTTLAYVNITKGAQQRTASALEDIYSAWRKGT